jgi:hypothetical protein
LHLVLHFDTAGAAFRGSLCEISLAATWATNKIQNGHRWFSLVVVVCLEPHENGGNRTRSHQSGGHGCGGSAAQLDLQGIDVGVVTLLAIATAAALERITAGGTSALILGSDYARWSASGEVVKATLAHKLAGTSKPIDVYLGSCEGAGVGF